MNRLRFASIGAAVLLLVAVPSCTAVNNFFDSIGGKRGPGRANDLVNAIERVYVECEVSREESRAAVEVLQKISDPGFQGDAAAGYAELVAAIDRSEDQAEKLRDRVGDMQRTADPLFREWEKDLEAFASEDMRERSRSRLTATRELYDAVVAATTPALDQYDSVNRGLRDHSLFLSHDLNRASLASIRTDVRIATKTVADLGSELDKCLKAARTYVDAASMPTADASPGVVAVSGSNG